MYRIEVVEPDQLKNNSDLARDILDIMRAKTREMGGPIIDEKLLPEWKEIVENNFSRNVATFCAYDIENKFVGFLQLKKIWSPKLSGKDLNTSAYCIMSVNFPNSQPMLNWSKPHPWKDAMNAIALHMKKNHVWDIYWTQPDRPIIQRQWRSGKDIMRYCSEWYDEERACYKWHRYVEAFVPENEVPKSDLLFYTAMAGITHDFPVVIRRFTLKNEYRPDWDKVKHWWPED